MMNKRIMIFIFSVSIALNIAFAITWAGYKLSKETAGNGIHFFQDDDKGQIWCPLHRSLNVSRHQWKQIEPRLLEFHSTSQGICEEVNNKRAEMIDILSSVDPNRQAISEKQKEIFAAQQKMQQLVIEHLLFEKSVLNSRQQEKFFRLFRQRSGCAGNQGVSGKKSLRQILNGDFESSKADTTNEQENK